MTPGCKHFLVRAFIYLFLAAVIVVPRTLSAAEDLSNIREDLKNNDWKIRLAAVEKLSNSRDEKTVRLLMEVADTHGEYWPVKIKAIQLLGETGDPKAIEVLLPIFNDSFLNSECPSIKSYTAAALGHFKDDTRVVNALINGVDDRELLTREASIQALGKIGNSKAVPHLIRLLNDQHVTVRLSSIKALEEIGNPQAIPYLQRIVENDGESVVKSQAKAALSKFQRSGEHN